jgi:hypothetical protein
MNVKFNLIPSFKTVLNEYKAMETFNFIKMRL